MRSYSVNVETHGLNAILSKCVKSGSITFVFHRRTSPLTRRQSQIYALFLGSVIKVGAALEDEPELSDYYEQSPDLCRTSLLALPSL